MIMVKVLIEKKYQAFKKMLNANQSKFVDSDAQLKEIEIQNVNCKKKEINYMLQKQNIHVK